MTRASHQRPTRKPRPGPELLLAMPVARFMREHWQRKPLLVRGALRDFRDPISPEELAGLACEDGVESRLVEKGRGRHAWDVTWGPHPEERFTSLPDRGWTLLVQELNRHVGGAALLLERFAFVPNVRVDDVMVSYAAPGGSVGPHLDSYDVFLVQGMGRRRWRYGTKNVHDTRFVAGLDLRILERFEADVDEVLEPGDMLYLPPGFAHHGIAVTPCMTYSIGFRAPRIAEMRSSFARFASSRSDADALLSDPALLPATNPGAVPGALLERVRVAIRSMDTSDESIDRWFASFATRLSEGHELIAPRKKLDERTIFARLSRGDVVVRSEEGRWAYLPRPTGMSRARRAPKSIADLTGRGARAATNADARSAAPLYLYFGGTEIDVPASAAELAMKLCASRRFDGAELAALVSEGKAAPARALIVDLFARGGLSFADRASVRAAR